MPWPEYRAPCNPQRDPPPQPWLFCGSYVSLKFLSCSISVPSSNPNMRTFCPAQMYLPPQGFLQLTLSRGPWPGCVTLTPDSPRWPCPLGAGALGRDSPVPPSPCYPLEGRHA